MMMYIAVGVQLDSLRLVFLALNMAYPSRSTPNATKVVSKTGGWNGVRSTAKIKSVPPASRVSNPIKELSLSVGSPADILAKLAPRKIKLVPRNPLPSGSVISTDQRSPHQTRSSPQHISESLFSKMCLLSISSSVYFFILSITTAVCISCRNGGFLDETRNELIHL